MALKRTDTDTNTMTKAYKCDRCGDYMDRRSSRVKQTETGTRGINDAFEDADMDLCHDCTEGLKKWWCNTTDTNH